jgi:two-component system, OmpR family, osmolarity sensor histidine kinase EnvZ
MRLTPGTAFGRLVYVLAFLLLVFAAFAALLLRGLGTGRSGEAYADLIVANVEFARMQQAASLPQPKTIVIQATAPALSKYALAAQSETLKNVRKHFGSKTQVGFEQNNMSRLWIKEPGRIDWVRVQLPPFIQVVQQMAVLLLVMGLVSVLIAAWTAHRWLIRPIVRLSEQVSDLGDDPKARLESDPKSPREVLILFEALKRAWQQQQQAIHEREFFLAGVSHDLRTPLSRLRFAIELNEHTHAPGRDAMAKDIDEMDDIIHQFVAFARDGVDEEMARADLSLLLCDLCEEANARGHSWRATIPEQCLLSIRVLSMRRALRNLMRNAELHGAPPFELSVEINKQTVIIEIGDKGAGVPAENMSQLGQAFYRVNASRSGVPGSGLGLALVQRTITQHDGTLQLSNRKEGGFLARIELPLGS